MYTFQLTIFVSIFIINTGEKKQSIKPMVVLTQYSQDDDDEKSEIMSLDDDEHKSSGHNNIDEGIVNTVSIDDDDEMVDGDNCE